MKISNKLLSWVLGCECRFEEIINVNTPNIPEYSIVYVKDINSATLGVYEKEYYINLHTFVHLAKVKAWEDHVIEIVCHLNTIKVITRNKGRKIFSDINHFSDELVLSALEWVAENVGGENA